MKLKLFILLTLCLTFTSCKTYQTYYEVCSVQSQLQVNNGRYQYSDNYCTISYNFWCNGGNAGFTFTNNTDEIVYVDLNKTFFIKNGIAYDYFLKRTVSSSASILESASVSNSGTAYGYFNTISSILPGSLTAMVGASSSAAKSTSVLTEEKSIIAIPPHASKDFSEYAISNTNFYFCEYNIAPQKKESPSYSFKLYDSPLTFSNYITYRVGDSSEEVSFTNDFFVDNITFLHSESALVKKEVGCNYDRSTIEIVKDPNPQKFYISYTLDKTKRFVSHDYLNKPDKSEEQKQAEQKKKKEQKNREQYRPQERQENRTNIFDSIYR